MQDLLNAKLPEGPIEERWDSYKFNTKLVNPANKRKYEIIVVGTGLAGASAAATLAELGYKVKAFTFHDSPRRSRCAPRPTLGRWPRLALRHPAHGPDAP